jgi:HEAT repeat protein
VAGREGFDALAAAREDEDEFVRIAALSALARIDDARVVPLLIGSLGDPEPRVRASVAYALAPTGKPWASKHRPSVRASLVGGLADPVKEVRHAAADGLRRLGDVDAVDALIAALGDPEAWVRGNVAETLGELERRRAMPALRGIAESDPDAFVRETAARAADHLARRGR